MSQLPRKKNNSDLQALTAAFNTGTTAEERELNKRWQTEVTKQENALKDLVNEINTSKVFSIDVGGAIEVTHKPSGYSKQFRYCLSHSNTKTGACAVLIYDGAQTALDRKFDVTSDDGKKSLAEYIGLQMKSHVYGCKIRGQAPNKKPIKPKTASK